MFKNFFNKNKIIENDSQVNSKNEKKLLLELSNTYISYSLSNDEKIKFVDLSISNTNNFKDLLHLWSEALDLIVSTIDVEIDITILIKSSNFIVKNSDNNINKDTLNKYFANKMALDEDNIEVKHIINNSYYILEYKFLQQILFSFKKYTIANIYDISLLNSNYIKIYENNFYLDISFTNFDMILYFNKIQKRSSNLNLSKLINKCSEFLYMDFETTYNNIKINFKNISSYEDLIASSKPLDKLLKEFIDELYDDIIDTLSYFSMNDKVNKIDSIYINGDVLELEFIIKILSDKLKINIIYLNKYMKINNIKKTNLTLFEKIDSSIIKKYNLNFEGLNYKDGRDEYVFIENKFVSKGQLTSSQKLQINTNKRKVKIGKNDKSDYFSNKAFYEMSMSELFEMFKYKIQNNDSSTILSSDNINKSTITNILSITMVLVILMYIFNTISQKELAFNNNLNSLEDRILRVDKLKKELNNRNKLINIENIHNKNDKIFWTQKFITISNLMPNEIWLSSVSLENKSKIIEKKEVITQNMILEARALPSAIGHISTIALYMDKLLNANYDFSKDFSSIGFGGAKIINEYGYDVIEFKLICVFNKNINVKEIEEKINDNKDKSISQNLQNISKNKKAQTDILDKL